MATIIPRAQWGAAPPRGISRTAWTKTTLWVHHSAGPPPANNPTSERAAVRGIQGYHQRSNGWSDIGYSYLIAPDSGRIYEGRGANVWGAHCPGHNDEPSVCIIGTFATVSPPEAARRAVWDLADHIGMRSLAGHRQGHPTSCPGDATMRTLVNAPRPAPPKSDPALLPHGNTLRLVLNGRAWAGWGQALGPINWIVRHGLAPNAQCAIAWRGRVWRGRRDVYNVCRSLQRTFSLDRR